MSFFHVPSSDFLFLIGNLVGWNKDLELVEQKTVPLETQTSEDLPNLPSNTRLAERALKNI